VFGRHYEHTCGTSFHMFDNTAVLNNTQIFSKLKKKKKSGILVFFINPPAFLTKIFRILTNFFFFAVTDDG